MTPTSPSGEQRHGDAERALRLIHGVPGHLDHRDRRHDGGDQQHRGELEVQPVLVQERGGERAQAEAPRRRPRQRRRLAPQAVAERAESAQRAATPGTSSRE